MINPAPFILKDRNARVGFTYTVTFPVNSMSGFGFTVEYAGQIATVTAMNVASYTITKNGSAVGVPFNVVKGDTISIDNLVKINNGAASTFLLRAPKFNEQNSAFSALTQVDTTRKHLFAINYTDQTISVIDTDTDTVESTIILPAGFLFQCILYRSADDHMYVFGLNRVCKIDANPSSPTFKNVYSLSGILNDSTNLGSGGTSGVPFVTCAYDSVNDIAIIGKAQSQGGYRWNFISGTANIGDLAATQNTQPLYVPPDKAYFEEYVGLFHKGGEPFKFTATNGGGAQFSMRGCYVAANNSIYTGRAAILRYNADTLALLNSIGGAGAIGNSSFNQIIGCVTYAPFFNLVFSLTYEANGGRIGVLDRVTNTLIGTFDRTNKEANDTIARSLVYGAKSKKLYFAGNGLTSVTRVHKLNPQLYYDNGSVALTDMIDGFITVGNMTLMAGNTTFDARRYMNSSIAFNHLIPS